MPSDVDQNPFEKLFRVLEPEAESVARGYETCRYKLVKFFAWRRCADPANLADETIRRLLKNIREGKEISPDKPYNFVYGIAHYVFKEDERDRKKRGEIVNIDEIGELANLRDDSKLDDCQKHCLERLSEDKRGLLLHYYLDQVSGEEIAEAEGLTINALRMKIFHIKNSLRHCCEKCRKQSSRRVN
jgi:DNA-directed RNA polymerase specialized sigma24 family protein